ncbi:MFS transporter [Nocardioides sp. WV_118_6]|uniref:MFS transporter n=1 Tax=Nocardioides simplex TaxID=2045 RepID=UPI0021500754|nr:MFS transporter [Pimelobacter simplex]UUW89320.1 MFS transporter [Pimelobacter simplex]UUW93148.1 MFS transporter [Pimelobacter simplex]
MIEAVAPARLGPGFRHLMASAWVSNLGDGIALAAGPLLVASQTRSPALVSMAMLLVGLPWLLFGLFAGAVADRVDRLRMVVVANLLRSVVLAVLCVTIVTGVVNIALVLGAMFLLGTAEVFADTAYRTFLPMLVDKADLGIANARLQAGFITLNQFAGAPLGAALFAVGMAVPFGAQILCGLLGVVLATRIALPPGPVRGEVDTHVLRDIAEGLRWLMGNAPVRTLALVIVTFNITWAAAWSILVLYSLDVLHMGPIGYGLLTSAAAAGGLVGTFLYGWLERHVPLATLMRACLSLEVVMHLGFAVTRVPWVAVLIMFGFGVYAFAWGTLSQAVRQRAVPMEFQGRVGSVYSVSIFGGTVIGSGLGGLIAQHGGVLAPFWFAFVGSGVTLALVWRQLGHIAHADDGVPGVQRSVGPAG